MKNLGRTVINNKEVIRSLHPHIRNHFCYDTFHNYRQNHRLVLCPAPARFKLGGPRISPYTILGLPLSMALTELCCL